MHRYTKEHKDFIIKNNYGKYAKELAKLFNEEFGTNIAANEIKYFRHNNHLNSGLNGRFKKGHLTHNKGKKQIEYMSKEAIERTKLTRFKKGNRPINYRPIGSERITKNGYIEIKIDDPNRWQLKHRYLYEQENGKIPDGYNLIFLDGNKRNLNLSNLKLVSKAEDLIMNNNKLFTSNSELTKSGVLIARVIDKVNKKKNEK